MSKIEYYNEDCMVVRKKRTGNYKVVHGLSHTRLAAIHSNMMMRCYNTKSERYPNYGGRGIIVCDEWKEAKCFFLWAIASGYSDDLTIERINNDGNYEPLNCKWIPARDQAKNKSNNTVLTHDGQTHCLAEWVRITGFPLRTIQWRIEHGWSNNQILSVKPDRKNRIAGERP